MMRFLIALVFTLIAASASASASAPSSARADVGLAIIRTGGSSTLEGMLYSGGSLTTRAQVNFSAFLIKHGDSTLLFDTGLGSQVAQQYEQDMPYWARPFFKYSEPVVTARSQLDQAGVAPVRSIVISHSHWDHASGLGDFPEAAVMLPPAELDVVRHAGDSFGGAWPSQVSLPNIKWRTFDFKPVAFEGFAASLDWFGDGSVVLVPMTGHTPGSVGAFVRVDSGRRYFLVGDAVWSVAALKEGRPKFWAARWMVDKDIDQTRQVIDQIRSAVARDPALTVVPSHDEAVQRRLGYFPAWVK